MVTYSIFKFTNILYQFISRWGRHFGHQVYHKRGILLEVQAIVLSLLLDEIRVEYLFDHLADASVAREQDGEQTLVKKEREKI